MRAVLAMLVLLMTGTAFGQADLAGPWPEPASVSGIRGQPVTFPSSSPFVLTDIDAAPPTTAEGMLFLPEAASPDDPAPAVVMLHGAQGVSDQREMTYGRQLAAMGVAALVVDAFGARRDRATGFVERLLAITESMLVADAYAALRWLDARPDIDGSRVVLVGFSYGGMATAIAAFAPAAERFAPDGLRFAGHVTYYAPCVVAFADDRATGAPVLMMYGTADEIVDPQRCGKLAAALRVGGAEVEVIAFEGAYHQWDGGFAGPVRLGRNLAPCRLRVERDGTVRDERTRLAMTGPISRRLILAACVTGTGYLIGRDDAVRARSNAALGAFLARAFGARDRV